MKEEVIVTLTLVVAFFTIFNPAYSWDNSNTNAKSNVVVEPVEYKISNKFIRFGEKTIITLQFENTFNVTTTFTYKAVGSNLNFQESIEETHFQALSRNLTLNPGERDSRSIFIWLTSIESVLVSSVQKFSLQVTNTNTSEILFSKSDWIWLYSNYDDLTIPQIPRTILESGFPLISTQDILVTYALNFNESTSQGFIRWYIHNTVEVSQKYQILISNQSQFIKFDNKYVDGYVCSLVCGDSSFYDANFHYSLPNGSSIAYIKIAVQITLDDITISNSSLLITLNNLKPLTETSTDVTGKYASSQDGEERVSIDISDFKYQNADLVIVARSIGLEKVILPDYQIINGNLSFSLKVEDFSSKFLLFLFNGTEYSSFEILKIRLIDIDRYSDPNESTVPKKSGGFTITLVVISLSSFITLSLLVKKYPK